MLVEKYLDDLLVVNVVLKELYWIRLSQVKPCVDLAWCLSWN